MKYITWIGGIALVGAIGIAALVASASVGDMTYAKEGGKIILNTPQKVDLGAAVLGVFPAANTATVQKFYCSWLEDPETKKIITLCSGGYNKTMTSDAYAALEVAGNAGRIVKVDGDNVTVERIALPKVADAGALIKIATFVNSGWSLESDILLDFGCKRGPEGSSEISCTCNHYTTVSPTQYAIDKKEGLVVRFAGRVTE